MSGPAFAAVLWDMDGTLIDSEPLHQDSLLHGLHAQGIAWQDGLEQALLGRDDAGVHAYCSAHLGLKLGLAEWARLRTAYFLAHLGRLSPRAECWEIFTHLQQRGVPQAIVSNASAAMLHANARALGLDTAQWVLVSRDDVARGKPHPEPYLRGAERLGVQATRCVVVEDSAPGAMAGLAAGSAVLYWPQDPHAASTPQLQACRSPAEAWAFFARCGWV